MNRIVEFTVSTVPGQHIDRNLAADTIVKALGNLGYMVDLTHQDCTAAVAAAMAAERKRRVAIEAELLWLLRKLRKYAKDSANQFTAFMSEVDRWVSLTEGRARASGGNGGAGEEESDAKSQE